MFACAFVRTKWSFGISLKYLSITIFELVFLNSLFAFFHTTETHKGQLSQLTFGNSERQAFFQVLETTKCLLNSTEKLQPSLFACRVL